jgi:hypothetical protein
VPMADMLTNTVGVMVFILIFAVLTASGAVIPKRLPMERRSSAEALMVVCYGGQLFPLVDRDAVVDEFVKPIGRATFSGASAWIAQFNSRRLETDFFVVTGEGGARSSSSGSRERISLELSLVLTPRKERGETAEGLRRAESAFGAILHHQSPDRRFIYFVVYPDCTDTFRAARSVAADAGFATGWAPWRAGGEIRLSIAGAGGAGVVPTPQ